MLVWRLTRPEHAPGLDGEGARLWGGRWNSPGVPMVYATASIALAALEYFVHLPPAMRRHGALPALKVVGLVVPDARIMDGENPEFSLTDSRGYGGAWCKSLATLAMTQPSRVIRRERILILNPRHPAMNEVAVTVIEDFTFDDRLGG